LSRPDPNRLDARAIERELARVEASLGRPCSVVERTGSTNDDAKQAAALGAPIGASFLAEEQTAGRGRAGHLWHSPPRENLYFSALTRPSVAPGTLPTVTLVVGVAVTRVLESFLGHSELLIKWPNDVLSADRKKLAGVLVEASFRGDKFGSLVIGVGVNVRATSFPPLLAGRATSLQLLGASSVDRNQLAAGLLAGIGEALERFERDGFHGFLNELGRRDALLDQPVRVDERAGLGAGIDALGRLILRGPAGETTAIASGEAAVGPFASLPG
jgi:BirA family biotin operon repressor/biotin-[acetyl-CoA-carboxylase] ligase